MLLLKPSLLLARSGSTSVRARSLPIPPPTSCSPSALHRLSVSGPRCRRRGCLRYRLFRCPPPNWQKGRDQKDCPLRPFNVLFENPSGVEATQVPQRSWCMRKRMLLAGYTHAYSSAYARQLQIISILDIIKPPSIEAFKEVYCEYLGFGSFLCA